MKVAVYRNLHTGTLSVQSREGESYGRVVDHPSEIRLKDCQFVVRQAGREKCLREKKKNVHAFIVGQIDCKMPDTKGDNVRYNPYEMGCFHSSGTPIFIAAEVSVFSGGGIFLNHL